VFEDQFLTRRCQDDGGIPTERWFLLRSAVFMPGVRRCCTNSPTTSGGSICSSIRMRILWPKRLPENVRPRIARMLGHNKFEFEWISLYKFQCRRMDKFIHGRVMFAGDAAHQVSPFGARGSNSGLEDAENLAWNLTAC